MSSTNRGAERLKDDYYVTPVDTIMDFLTEFEEDRERMALAYPGDELTILDPCAGGDAKNPCSYKEAIRQFKPWEGCKIRTNDIREDSGAISHIDYLKWEVDYKPWIIMSNPPFSLALEFINKALADVHRGGLVIMLLRVNFFASRKRFQWWRGHMPILTYVHSRRPSFKPGGTDSTEYAHFVWKQGFNLKFTNLRVI